MILAIKFLQWYTANVISTVVRFEVLIIYLKSSIFYTYETLLVPFYQKQEKFPSKSSS